MNNTISVKIITPDGTTLQSFSQHDFKMYKDKNGKEYGIDGGPNATRIIGNLEDLKIIKVSSDDDFNLIRKEMYWGTYGKSGKDKFKWVYLNEMSDEHIKSIIETQKHIPEWRVELFTKELQHRKEHNITIKDN